MTNKRRTYTKLIRRLKKRKWTEIVDEMYQLNLVLYTAECYLCEKMVSMKELNYDWVCEECEKNESGS